MSKLTSFQADIRPLFTCRSRASQGGANSADDRKPMPACVLICAPSLPCRVVLQP
jgi:hypothetical protein